MYPTSTKVTTDYQIINRHKPVNVSFKKVRWDTNANSKLTGVENTLRSTTYDISLTWLQKTCYFVEFNKLNHESLKFIQLIDKMEQTNKYLYAMTTRISQKWNNHKVKCHC